MPKALIDDTDPGGHGSNVKGYFDNDAPGGWSSEVRNKGASGIVDDAIAENVEMIIRSLIDVWNDKSEWDRAWDEGIIVVHSHGSNSNDQLTDPPRIFSAVVVGGESPAGGYEDERSFGPGLEVDAEAHDGDTAESYATPTVAALLARLYDHFQSDGLTEKQTWLKARAVVRQLALRNNDEDKWSPERGFGLVYSFNNSDSDFQFLTPQLQPPFDVQLTEGAPTLSLTWEPWDTGKEPEVLVSTSGDDGEVTLGGSSGDVPNMGLSSKTLELQSVKNGTKSAAEAATTQVSNLTPDRTMPSGARNGLEASVSVPTLSGATTYFLERERLDRGFSQVSEAAQPSFTDEPPDPYKPYNYRIKSDAPSLGGDWFSAEAAVRGNPAFPAASFKV